MEIRRVVVGLAPGMLSDRAVARAMSLARNFDARLHVVHGAGVRGAHLGAARGAFFAAHGPEAFARARDSARGRLELLVEDPTYAELPLDDYLEVREEPGTEAVLARAKEVAADLIVIGAHRHRKPLDLGGTTRAVLAHSDCPVWVEPAETVHFERLLAAVDLSPATEGVLAAARGLGQRFELPVRVLHVFSPPEFAYEPGVEGEPAPTPSYFVADLREAERTATRERVSAFEWGAFPVELVFAEGEPAPEIVRHADAKDLIVVGTHGHSGFSRALLGSSAYRVLLHAAGPVLVVPHLGERHAGPMST